MTQALLNNLNITTDSSFKSGDTGLKTAVSDFEKIFESQTKSDNSGKNNEDVKTNIKNNENTNNQRFPNSQTIQTIKPAEQEVKTNTKNVAEDEIKTLGDLKNQTQEDVLAEEIATSILENAAETVIDLIIEKTDTEETDEKAELNKEETSEETDKDNTNEENDTAENSIDDTNITEEDSTMYKEINAPENPATVLLLSQIQTNNSVSLSAESTEPSVQETLSPRLNSETQEMALNRQFEDVFATKDMPAANVEAKKTMAPQPEQSKQNPVLSEKVVKELNIESVNSENTQNSSGDLMQNQTPQEQTVKIMIQGDIKADAKIEIAKSVEVKPAEITQSKIIEQISKQLDGMYNNSKLNMVLNPGTLGKLHLHLMNTKDGLVAQFTVTTQEAKDILMKGLNGLKDTLLAQGISVDNVSVKLDDSETENSFDWTEQEGSRGGNKQQGTRKQKEEKPFEQMMFEMENNDNLV